MNLCIDQGNSFTKIGVFDQDKPVEFMTFEKFGSAELSVLNARFPVSACILSSVIGENDDLIAELQAFWPGLIVLSHQTPVPVTNNYRTPETLGKDRLAAIVGASFLNPVTDVLVIDAGTAITYDFIDSKQVYSGGNIAPGLNLRLKALHEFTSKLPLVEAQSNCPELGNDTESAIAAGALYGIIYEIDGYISHLKIKYPQLSVFLTGGSTFYFDTKLKNPIFVERNLVLIGLNRILQYNVQK